MTTHFHQDSSAAVIYHKLIYFVKEDAMQAGKEMGDYTSVMEFEFTKSWNWEQLNDEN